MSDNIEFTPEARWRHLRENGPKLLVDLASNETIDDKPVWLDEARFALAKQAVEKYYIGIVYSSLTGLLLILQLPDGLEPLLVTGNSKDIPSLYKRYLSTILHVNSWYEDDIFNPETKGYKSIRQVRSMHKRVQQLMNDKHQVKDVNGKKHLWMTQYDVAMTQFAFIGLAMLYPHKSAMIAASPEDMELINYYWRVLGYLMGMRDDMNACQFDKYEDIKEFNRLIFEHEYKDKFKDEKQACPKGLEMTKSICLALNYFTPLITFNSLAHWWSDCFTFNGYQLEPLTLKDKILLMWTDLSFNRLLKSKGFMKFSTKLHKRRFDRRLKRRDIVHEQLKEQYKNCPHLTFYSDRLDYFSKTNASSSNATTESSAPDQNGAVVVVVDAVNNREAQDANDDNNNHNSGNKNNSEELAPQPINRKTIASPIAVTTFKGCPMGYDAVLPALQVEEETLPVPA